ncbi:MAG: hypothetical protein Fur005_34920 [Roseiflexaceae bacterium]
MSDEPAFRRIHIPGLPGVEIVLNDPKVRLTDIFDAMAQTIAQVSQSLPHIGSALAKQALRDIVDLDRLAHHVWAQRAAGISPIERAIWLDTTLLLKISELELIMPNQARLLRLRYYEYKSTRAIQEELAISASHYHRLHQAALAWLAAAIERELSQVGSRWITSRVISS